MATLSQQFDFVLTSKNGKNLSFSIKFLLSHAFFHFFILFFLVRNCSIQASKPHHRTLQFHLFHYYSLLCNLARLQLGQKLVAGEIAGRAARVYGGAREHYIAARMMMALLRWSLQPLLVNFVSKFFTENLKVS